MTRMFPMHKVYTSHDTCLLIAFLVTGWSQSYTQWCLKQSGSPGVSRTKASWHLPPDWILGNQCDLNFRIFKIKILVGGKPIYKWCSRSTLQIRETEVKENVHYVKLAPVLKNMISCIQFWLKIKGKNPNIKICKIIRVVLTDGCCS